MGRESGSEIRNACADSTAVQRPPRNARSFQRLFPSYIDSAGTGAEKPRLLNAQAAGNESRRHSFGRALLLDATQKTAELFASWVRVAQAGEDSCEIMFEADGGGGDLQRRNEARRRTCCVLAIERERETTGARMSVRTMYHAGRALAPVSAKRSPCGEHPANFRNVVGLTFDRLREKYGQERTPKQGRRGGGVPCLLDPLP